MSLLFKKFKIDDWAKNIKRSKIIQFACDESFQVPFEVYLLKFNKKYCSKKKSFSVVPSLSHHKPKPQQKGKLSLNKKSAEWTVKQRVQSWMCHENIYALHFRKMHQQRCSWRERWPTVFPSIRPFYLPLCVLGIVLRNSRDRPKQVLWWVLEMNFLSVSLTHTGIYKFSDSKDRTMCLVWLISMKKKNGLNKDATDALRGWHPNKTCCTFVATVAVDFGSSPPKLKTWPPYPLVKWLGEWGMAWKMKSGCGAGERGNGWMVVI